MKEKIIGVFAIVLGLISLFNTLHPLSVLGYWIQPYLFPIFIIVFGWLELHGRVPFDKKHVAHKFAFAALSILIILVLMAIHHKI